MLNMSLPWWEFVLRAVAVYAFLMIGLRLTGKRQIGQTTPSDLVLLLVLANTVQNSMNGGDNSLVGGLVSASTLLALNMAVAWFAWRHRSAERVIEGQPEVLVHNGHVFEQAIARAYMTRHDLARVLRRGGAERLSDVHYAILENDGGISIKLKDRAPGGDAAPRPAAAATAAAGEEDSSLWRSVERATGDA